jgi:hypothetical protein
MYPDFDIFLRQEKNLTTVFEVQNKDDPVLATAIHEKNSYHF